VQLETKDQPSVVLHFLQWQGSLNTGIAFFAEAFFIKIATLPPLGEAAF